MIIDCYAQRLLNPFRGAMHTVKYDAAEAVTVDGLHWDIYVTNDALLADLDRSVHAQAGDIHYGRWSPLHGIRRGDRRSGNEIPHMEALGAIVVHQLTDLHRHLPFAFKDEFELWLLDGDDRPLALLDSALDEDGVAPEAAPVWRAGYAARERFTSPAMQVLHGDCAGDYLTRYINERAGPRPAAQWFQRLADGSGMALATGGRVPAGSDRVRQPADFPPLLLADIGHDDTHRRLIDDYHAWQAVWLLTLPGLEPDVRRSLEQQARRQAAVVESQFRLYPQIIDGDRITAARVEARLRTAAPVTPSVEDQLATFYIELNPCGNE